MIKIFIGLIFLSSFLFGASAVVALVGTLIAKSAVLIATFGAFGAQLIGYAVSVLVSKALGLDKKDSIEDTGSYAQNKIKNIKTNNATLPIPYGINRIGGNSIWQNSRGTNNVDLHQLIALSYDVGISGASSITEVWIGDVNLPITYTDVNDDNIFSSEDGFTQVYAVDNLFAGNMGAPTSETTLDSLENLFPSTNLFTNGSSFSTDLTINSGNISDLINNTVAIIIESSNESFIDGQITYDLGLGNEKELTSLQITCKKDINSTNIVSLSTVEASNDVTFATKTILLTNKSLGQQFYTCAESTVEAIIGLPKTGEYRYYRLNGFYRTVNCPSGQTLDMNIVQLKGSEGGFINDYIPPNLSALSIRQIYDNTDNNSVQEVNAITTGKVVKSIDDASTISALPTTSNNSPEILLDLLLSGDVDYSNVTYSYGLNLPESKINIPSFFNVKEKCIEYGFTTNIVFTTSTTIQQMISEVLTSANMNMAYYSGQYHLFLPEKNRTTYKTITDDDIIEGTLSFTKTGTKNLINKAKIKFINPNDQWQLDEAKYQDDDLIELDGDLYEEIIDIKGCTNAVQADTLAKLIVGQQRYTGTVTRENKLPLTISFSLEAGKHIDFSLKDLFEYTFDYNVSGITKIFDIIQIEHSQDGTMGILATEHSEQQLKDENGNYIIGE